MSRHSDEIEQSPTPFLKVGQYLLGETLGLGSFGKVKIAHHEPTRQEVAVKILNREKLKSLDVTGKVRREIETLKLFQHPHIIKMYQVISSPNDIFIVMEYVSGGELFDYITKKGRLKEGEGRRFFQQIISGVDYCHRHMIVHRDLKPENLLLDKNLQVKIADFGLSNIMTDGEFLKTSCGSPNYAAPEVISGNLYAGPEVDVWSCGVILYAILCGSLPFDDDHVTNLFRKIKSGVFQVPSYLSSGVVDLLKRMLRIDPMRRAKVENIRSHSWFKQDLPGYLFPCSTGNEPPEALDQNSLQQVCTVFGAKKTEVIEGISEGDPYNQLAIGYRLIVDNRIIAHEAAKAGFREYAANPTQPSMKSKRPAIKQPKSWWKLGFNIRIHPIDLMEELYHVFKQLNYEWKTVNLYLVRVRSQTIRPGKLIKVALQIYQVGSRKYLLDFQSFSEDEASNKQPMEIMAFFDMSFSIINKIQHFLQLE